jgi:hypothetical protein
MDGYTTWKNLLHEGEVLHATAKHGLDALEEYNEKKLQELERKHGQGEGAGQSKGSFFFDRPNK